MTVMSLRFCARVFSSCGKWGPLFIAVRWPLTIAASLVAEHRLQTRRLSNCGSRAQLLRGMCDLPRPGLEPVSPALAGRFSTTAPPGKPCLIFNSCLDIIIWTFHHFFPLRAGFSLVAASGGCSSLRYAGFSLRWPLLLQSTGSRRAGFNSCGAWAQ